MGKNTQALHTTFNPKPANTAGPIPQKIEEDVKNLHKKKTGRRRRLEGMNYRTTTLEIEESLFVKMKNKCFHEEMTMAEYIEELIKNDLDHEKKTE